MWQREYNGLDSLIQYNNWYNNKQVSTFLCMYFNYWNTQTNRRSQMKNKVYSLFLFGIRPHTQFIKRNQTHDNLNCKTLLKHLSLCLSIFLSISPSLLPLTTHSAIYSSSRQLPCVARGPALCQFQESHVTFPCLPAEAWDSHGTGFDLVCSISALKQCCVKT